MKFITGHGSDVSRKYNANDASKDTIDEHSSQEDGMRMLKGLRGSKLYKEVTEAIQGKKMVSLATWIRLQLQVTSTLEIVDIIMLIEDEHFSLVAGAVCPNTPGFLMLGW